VTAGISGYSEFAQYIESGRLRAIGISSRARVPGLEVPTLVEQGLDVELANWRAVVAPPDLDERERRTLTAVVERMVQSASWQETVQRLGWTDLYLAGPDFDAFLETERVRVARIVTRLRGVEGGETAGPIGEWVFPATVLTGGALVLALLIAKRTRAPEAPGPNGSRRAHDPAGFRGRHAQVARVALGLVAFVSLLQAAGFVVSGTVLFACTASAFGSRRWVRDAGIGLAFCAATYGVFVYGLGVALP
jgi:hypothetical protein